MPVAGNGLIPDAILSKPAIMPVMLGGIAEIGDICF
jgi:hypothetical protein